MVLSGTPLALALAVAGAAIVATTGQGTRAGALAGLAVAFVSILGIGPATFLPLATFVLGAGALTRVGRDRKEALGTAEANRGRRGVRHVIAKLGIPTLLAIVAFLTGDDRPLALAYAAGIAAALADTAGTEVGPLFRGPVVRLEGWTVRLTEHGAPGGMSAAGIAATMLGAGLAAGASLASGLVDGFGASVAASAALLASLLESVVGGSAAGRALGHFGRNALVSVVASGAGLGAALLRAHA